MKRRLCCLTRIVSVFLLLGGCISETSEWNQVKDLEGAMYEEMKYSRACIKLLTDAGVQGCEAPNQMLVTAPVLHKKDLSRFPRGLRAVLVPAQEVDAFLLQVLQNQQLREQVAGVLIDPTTGPPDAQSLAPTFPGAAYAPYNASSYAWNPWGTSFNRQWFGFPIYMLTPSLATDTARRADYNAENELKGGRHVASMSLPMHANGNSLQCITEQTCLPVGSYGVWTAVPALPDPFYVNATARPITLVLAQMDSNALIHDLSRAAGTALSGLIAATVAVTLLVQSNHSDTYSRQLAFAALPGEAFDFIGSRRLLYEMARNSSYARGLRLDLIDQVVEVGQVGMAYNKAANQSRLFLHTQQTGGFGDASALLAAAQAAGTAEAPQVLVQPANASNPGVPPSSLMPLLRLKPSLAGLVISDFDTSFRNPFYQSVFDDGTNLTVQSMVDASVVVARTLHALVTGPSTPVELAVNRTTVAALVVAFVRCLMLDQPGLRCSLASALMNPDITVSYDGSTSAAVTGYPGVLQWLGVNDAFSSRSSRSKPNLSRFLFNYLSNLTAVPHPNTTAASGSEGAACDPNYNDCKYPLACVGWRYGTKDPEGMGRCRNTSTTYFPAYSTRLKYSQNRWWVDNSSATWEAATGLPPDSVWTESNWPSETPTLTLYQEEAYATQVITLVVGLVLTTATGVVSWLGVKAFEKHMKSQ